MLSSLSSSLLTEEERRRKDAAQRRILRIQQVREQEKQYALKLLGANKKQISSQQNQILADIKHEWEAHKHEDMSKIQEKIDYALAHVGAAQVDANHITQQQAKVATQAYEHLLEERVLEAERFDIACEWAQSSNRQRQAQTLQKMEWRANATSVEKERSKAKVAEMKVKANSKTLQKENVILEPQAPQVIKAKLVPNQRVGVSYKATRFHEIMCDDVPDSPAKSPPVPTPRDTNHFKVEENAYTSAVAMEQAELMRGDQEREEQTRKAIALQQRTKIAHSKFIAEREGKEAEKVLGQFEQARRRQKANQIGELSRIVERHAEVRNNPINEVHLTSEFSQDDGTMALSWSSLPREKVAKGRKNKINRAFEEEFLNPAPQVTEEADKVSVDIDIFSALGDLPTPPPTQALPSTTRKALPTVQNHPRLAAAPNTSITTKPPSTSTLKSKINKAKQPISVTKTIEAKDNEALRKDLPTEPTSARHSPALSDEVILEDFPLSHYLTPSSYSESNVTPNTTEPPSTDRIHHSLLDENPIEQHHNTTNHTEVSASDRSNNFLPPQTPSLPSTSSSPALPLFTRDVFASEAYLRDFERKMRELDEHFHRALGYLPPPSHVLPSPHSSVPSPRSALHSPPIQPESHSSDRQSPNVISPLSLQYPSPPAFQNPSPLTSQLPSPLSSQFPSPRQSSPPPQASHHFSNQSSVASLEYRASGSPIVGHISLSGKFSPKDDHLLDDVYRSFATSRKPIPSIPDNRASSHHAPLPIPIADYPVFTFVLNSPHAPSTPPQRSRKEQEEEEEGEGDDIFSISPLSSNPSPHLPSPPRSPYLSSSPLSNHSLSYSTDSLFMST